MNEEVPGSAVVGTQANERPHVAHHTTLGGQQVIGTHHSEHHPSLSSWTTTALPMCPRPVTALHPLHPPGSLSQGVHPPLLYGCWPSVVAVALQCLGRRAQPRAHPVLVIPLLCGQVDSSRAAVVSKGCYQSCAQGYSRAD